MSTNHAYDRNYLCEQEILFKEKMSMIMKFDRAFESINIIGLRENTDIHIKYIMEILK